MTTIEVAAKRIPTYAEHHPASRLQVGEIYFRIHFSDAELLVPYLEPAVYIGRDLAVGDSGMLYFQDADSYLQGSRFGLPADVEPTVTRVFEHQSSSVFEYEKALDELLRCALRRQRETPT